MLARSRDRIESMLSEDDVVLDVGGWAKPFPRADWVLDLMPYESRGLYGELEPDSERFGPDTWAQLDMCGRTPWPFADDQFDFAICSHTLEDIRDPVWVCGELSRVARAGYLEVPSRLEEQSFGVHGPWVGWSHHRWLADVDADGITFVAKPHVLHGRSEFQFPTAFWEGLSEAERVQTMFWEEAIQCRERIFMTAEELDSYLAQIVRERLADMAPSRLRSAGRRLLRR